jgi:hypothetical protein
MARAASKADSRTDAISSGISNTFSTEGLHEVDDGNRPTEPSLETDQGPVEYVAAAGRESLTHLQREPDRL